jgi:hypothetical protein
LPSPPVSATKVIPLTFSVSSVIVVVVMDTTVEWP